MLKRALKSTQQKVIVEKNILDNPSIDPGTSHMLRERSTTWADSPVDSRLYIHQRDI